MIKRIRVLLTIVVLMVGSFWINQYLERKVVEAERIAQQENGAAAGRRGYDAPIDETHPALLWFSQTYETREAFLGFVGDLTGNGAEDLIILFHEDERTDICWMCVAMQQSDDRWIATEPVRAPVENQKVRVFDMDKESPLEFVITGEKNGKIGYAIYRVTDGELADLFAEDMMDCC